MREGGTDHAPAVRPLGRPEGASNPRVRARSTASWRLWTPSLAYRWRLWVPTVFTDRNSSAAISWVVRWVGR